MDINTITALTIFLATFVLILFEITDRMVASLAGAAAMITAGAILKFYTYEQALGMIELDTLALLFGMMALVGMLEKTGAFQYIAIKIAHLSKGKPVVLLLMLGFTTSILSMFLDNVTTVVLIIPVTISITSMLRISAVPFLIAEAMMSNIGGLATIVGDPPNLIIASSVKDISFMSFFLHLIMYSAISWVIAFFSIMIIFKKEMSQKIGAVPEKENAEEKLQRESDSQDIQRLMEMKPEDAIKNKKSAIKLFWVFAAVIILFFISERIGIRPAVVAIAGAAAGFILTKAKVDETLSKVDFSILLFFSGLFVTVGGLEHCGFLKSLSSSITSIANQNMLLCAIVTLWSSATASAIIDNIPFTIAMIPVIQSLGQQMGDMNLMTPLWWALAIGVGLGGNGTIVGATANVIAVRNSEKYKNETCVPITTMIWMKSGLVTTVLTLTASTVLFVIFYAFMNTR